MDKEQDEEHFGQVHIRGPTPGFRPERIPVRSQCEAESQRHQDQDGDDNGTDRDRHERRLADGRVGIEVRDLLNQEGDEDGDRESNRNAPSAYGPTIPIQVL